MAVLSLTRLLVSSLLGAAFAAAYPGPGPLPRSPASSGKVCTVTPLGCKRDDVPQILQAFDDCNKGGTVVFLEGKTYHIATVLNPVISDVTIEWRGLWQVRRHRRGCPPIIAQTHEGD